MSEYRMLDTKRADGVYIAFEMKLTDDAADFDPSDMEDGQTYAAQIAAGDLEVYGVQAEAHILIVSHGHGTTYTIASAGVWGVMVKDAKDPYLATIYGEELETLRGHITMLGAWQELPQ